MELILVRHGPAEPADPDTPDRDADRSLTRKGQRRVRDVADGLVTLADTIDVVATSPLVRARETAELLARAWDDAPVETVDSLGPDGDRDAFLSWLQDRGEMETVVAVGHEPGLGLLASWFLADPLNHFVELRPAGACALGWPDYPTPGHGWLRWALPPRFLRRVGR